MYGSEQLEQDLQWLESQRVEGARTLIAGPINGFQKLQLDTEIDASSQINTSIWDSRSRVLRSGWNHAVAARVGQQ